MKEDLLLGSVKRHEGLRLIAYQDSRGIWTAGYGRNLQVLRITEQQASDWLAEDLSTAIDQAKKFSIFECLKNDARENAFCEMVFNMGAMRVRCFTEMLAAIAREDWRTAAAEMLNSAWARQVGARALELAQMMLSGEFPQT